MRSAGTTGKIGVTGRGLEHVWARPENAVAVNKGRSKGRTKGRKKGWTKGHQKARVKNLQNSGPNPCPPGGFPVAGRHQVGQNSPQGLTVKGRSG